MKSVYTDFTDWLIFSVHQFLKISVNIYTDFKKLVYSDFIDLLIFSGHWHFFSVHQFLKISVNRYTDFQKLVYTDFQKQCLLINVKVLIDWLIFSVHQLIFSAH